MSSPIFSLRMLAVFAIAWIAVPAQAQTQRSVGELFQLYGKSLVVIEGKEGRGGGAVLTIRGVNYIVTNTHVLAKNASFVTDPNAPPTKSPTTFFGADGETLTVNTAGFAKGHDMARLTTKEKLVPIPVMAMVSQTVKIDDEVVIFGISGGAGVFVPSFGKVTGIGPRQIEFDSSVGRLARFGQRRRCPRSCEKRPRRMAPSGRLES